MAADLHAALRTHFGFDAFRPGQAEAVESLLAGHDTLVVMPTGSGKSLIYQLAALERPGLTLVISPLIALMKDQVDSLARRGIQAAFVNSTLPGDEQVRRLQAASAGRVRLLYVAPERLRSLPLADALRRTSVGLLAVDEAHCISQWGHDFRPAYTYIAEAGRQIGDPVTVALTATATPQVQDDIIGQLALDQPHRIVTGFNRPNLTFDVLSTMDDAAKLHELQRLLGELREGAAIIYAGTRREAEEVADFVASLGVEARYYHAGLDSEIRARVQEEFISGDLPVVVATNAFGMGIDRPDVRMVVHYNVPGTLEAYYQEAGRAGRDGEPARVTLLYAPRDRSLQEYFIANDAPTLQDVRNLFNLLSRSAPGRKQEQVWLSRDDLALKSALPEIKLRLALAQLEEAGSLEYLGDDGARMLLRCGAWNQQAVERAAAGAEERRRRRYEQLAAMIHYAEADSCRRRILLDHFGDRGAAEAADCCDNCRSRPAQPAPGGDVAALSQAQRTALIILDTVRRLKWATGRTNLARTLAGSTASVMASSHYDESAYYGRLAVFKVREIEGMIDQMLRLGHLKLTGGNRPVLRLSPQGQAALKARSAIDLTLPRVVQRQQVHNRKVEREAGGTVELTARLFGEGLSPAQIAGQRMLSDQTIYGHFSQLIAQGRLPLASVVAADVIAQVRESIARQGSVSYLAPLKMLLPESISYNEIRCVVEDWKREHGLLSGDAAPASAERMQRVVELGTAGSSAALPELVAALQDPDGNVRRLAASALGKIGNADATAPLLALLEREAKPQVRLYAVSALGNIGDAQARPALERIAADQEERDYTRRGAQNALSRIGGNRATSAADPVADFLARSQARPLPGPWQEGWALGFHSGFGGADWRRSKVGDLTYRLKYESDESALEPLVEEAAALCRHHPALAGVDALVAVIPSTAHRLDPVASVVAGLAARLGKPVLAALSRTRRTDPQKDMRSLALKRANVAGAFAVAADVSGKRLLVVDDLYDSGATLGEVTRILRRAGAAGVCVLTLTRTIHSDG